jgi:hypothetical protein
MKQSIRWKIQAGVVTFTAILIILFIVDWSQTEIFWGFRFPRTPSEYHRYIYAQHGGKRISRSGGVIFALILGIPLLLSNIMILFSNNKIFFPSRGEKT